MRIAPLIALLVSPLAPPVSAFAAEGTLAIILSGGADKESNHVRYENNVRLFSDILDERGYPRAARKVLFNRGVNSEVMDPESKNDFAAPQYGVPSAFVKVARKNLIPDIIDGPATQKEVSSVFAGTVAAAAKKRVKKVILFSTDHGSANTNDPGKSYISLADDEKLSYDDQEKFVRGVTAAGAKAVLIGDQCYSGHNMQIAIKHPNACAFAAASPDEMSSSLDRELADIKKPVPRLGYSTYSYFFSCALHRPGKLKNLAEQDCDPTVADFNHDGQVTLAEAHYYALARMDPISVPQISSQTYARDLLGEKISAAPALGGGEPACLNPEDALNGLVKSLGRAVNPALNAAIRERLDLESKVIDWLMSDSDLLAELGVSADDPAAKRTAALLAAHAAFEKEHAASKDRIRQALRDRNEARNQREALRAEAAAELIGAGDDVLAESSRLMRENEAALNRPGLPPAERQLIQNRFNRAKQDAKTRVEYALSEPAKRAERYAEIKKKIDDLDKQQKDLVDAEQKLLSGKARLRRTYQFYQDRQAELAVLITGSPEQKSKLVQLYECENETL